MLEPPSPESHENSLQPDAVALGSSPGELHSPPGPQIIPSVEMPDPSPISDNPASSEGNRRSIGEWFRTVMTKRSNRTPRQPRSEAPPQPSIPSRTKETPSNEKPSTMSPGRRQAVSVPSSVDTGHRYLTTRRSGRLESSLLDHRLVHVSYPFMNIFTYYALQKNTAAKPAASSQLPKTTPRTEAGPANVVPGETKAEPSGAQNNVQARVYFVRFAAGTHNTSYSQVNRLRPLRTQKLSPPIYLTKRKLSLLVDQTT
jgi:hypothetical protein